jgi:hypothetical protein
MKNKIDKSWELEDVVKTAKRYPDSFFIPSKKERENKKIGDEVKLHFVIKKPVKEGPIAERMWVKITKEKSLLSKYKGKLTNQPLYIKDLNVDDEIEFDSKNIAQTIIKKGDPMWIDSSDKKALVSKMCLEKDGVVRFLYREKPDRKEDSGWRMFSGFESDEYNNNARNIQIMEVGYLLSKDPSLLEPLKGDYGAVFEREDKKSTWKKVTDWEPTDE